MAAKKPPKDFGGSGWRLTAPAGGFKPDPDFKPSLTAARWVRSMDAVDTGSRVDEWIEASAETLPCAQGRWLAKCGRSQIPVGVREGGHYRFPSFEYECGDGGERQGELIWGDTHRFDLVYGAEGKKACKVLRLAFRARWVELREPSRQNREPGLLAFSAMIRGLRPMSHPEPLVPPAR